MLVVMAIILFCPRSLLPAAAVAATAIMVMAERVDLAAAVVQLVHQQILVAQHLLRHKVMQVVRTLHRVSTIRPVAVVVQALKAATTLAIRLDLAALVYIQR